MRGEYGNAVAIVASEARKLPACTIDAGFNKTRGHGRTTRETSARVAVGMSGIAHTRIIAPDRLLVTRNLQNIENKVACQISNKPRMARK